MGTLLVSAVAVMLWNTAAIAQLSPRYDHSAIYDTARQRMLVFGGTNGAGTFYNDVWELSLTGVPHWTQRATSGAPPSQRSAHSAVYDPVRDRMLVFFGLSPDGGLHELNEVWSLSLSDTTWSLLQPAGIGPAARFWASAIYDPLCDRVLLYGGKDLLATGYPEIWSLSLSLASTPTWEQVALAPTSGLPAPRNHHSAIYDPVRERMLVFSGEGSASNDVWSFSLDGASCISGTTLPAWTQVLPSGALRPPRLGGHTAIYDPVGDRMIVFGGNDGIQPRNDVWALSLANTTWSVMPGAGDVPNQRARQTSVFDPVSRRMVVFGGLPDNNEPTWALSLGPSMRWSPWRPKIEVSPTELQMPTITVGDVASVTFSVHNLGLQPMQVTDVRLPHSTDQLPVPGMRLSSPAPFELTWNQAQAETLFLAASVPDTVRDSLLFIGNDPLAPRLQVPVSFQVLDLDFETRVLGAPLHARLGVSFDVVVTPDPGVHIESGTLFYRIAGSGSAFESLALTPLSTDFIGTVPASTVTEQGVEYYVQVMNHGITATRPRGAPAVVDTQVVEPATAITSVIPRPTSGTDFLSGRGIPVQVVLPPGAIFVSGSLYYRRGGESDWSSDTLVTIGSLGAVIPDSMVGPRGVEYRAEARTLTADLWYPAAVGAFDTIRVKVPNLVEPHEHPASRYRLMSVPLDFGPDFAGSLDALLSDLGPYDPVNWRAFIYEPTLPGNIEFISAPEQFQPQPGRAFWLITRGSHRVDTQPGVGFSTPTGGDYSIPLEAGWNLIGDPFDFPVKWSEVGRDPTAVNGHPVAFDPSAGTTGEYVYGDASFVLQPFEGCFVKATRATTLSVSSRAATTAAGSPMSAPASGTDDGDLWRLRLEARTEGAIDTANEFGLHSGATEGFDRLDGCKAPPPPGSWVRVAFPHPDWGEQSGEYRRDLRGPGSDGETWEIEVRSEKPGEAVTLRVSPEIAAGSDLVVRLLDHEQGSSVGLVTTPVPGDPSGYSIVSFGPGRPYRLAIVAGTQDYVDRSSAPDLVTRVSLDPGVPNPFQFATRIRFGLPRAERVTLEIYDVLGHRVATLLDRAQLSPGYHAMTWDGRKSDGDRASSGVYLLRLVSGGDLITRKLVLAR